MYHAGQAQFLAVAGTTARPMLGKKSTWSMPISSPPGITWLANRRRGFPPGSMTDLVVRNASEQSGAIPNSGSSNKKKPRYPIPGGSTLSVDFFYLANRRRPFVFLPGPGSKPGTCLMPLIPLRSSPSPSVIPDLIGDPGCLCLSSLSCPSVILTISFCQPNPFRLWSKPGTCLMPLIPLSYPHHLLLSSPT